MQAQVSLNCPIADRSHQNNTGAKFVAPSQLLAKLTTRGLNQAANITAIMTHVIHKHCKQTIRSQLKVISIPESKTYKQQHRRTTRSHPGAMERASLTQSFEAVIPSQTIRTSYKSQEKMHLHITKHVKKTGRPGNKLQHRHESPTTSNRSPEISPEDIGQGSHTWAMPYKTGPRTPLGLGLNMRLGCRSSTWECSVAEFGFQYDMGFTSL